MCSSDLRVHVSGEGRALLGIRPERVRVERDGASSGTPALAGRVTAIEPLGRELLCHVTLARAGERTVQALTTQDGIGEGSDVRLAFDPSDLHLFPAE